MENFFKLKELNTTLKTEILAGITTFATMSYIIVVNPKILAAAGMPFGASMTATILAAFLGCMIMGFYVNKPFAVAPYMGENAFIAYTVVLALGFQWQTALGAIFLSGLIFFFLTLIKLRPWLVNSMSETMKLSFSVGLGFFLILVGLVQTGIVKFSTNPIPLQIGDLHNPKIILAVLCFILTVVLMQRKVKGAILIGIITTTAIGLLLGDVSLPERIISMPPSIAPILGKLDIMGVFNIKFLPMFFIIFLLVYVDTMGTLIGVSYKAGLLDENGNLPKIKKPMLCDSITTMFASAIGTTTSGVYLESITGIASGGKSGITAITVGLLFLSGLFFAPLFSMIPSYAYAPALIIVGMLMVSIVSKINFEEMTEYVPALFTVATMVFTYNIGIGMAAGFILYPLLKLLSGKKQDTNPAMWILFIFSIGFFIVYPY